MNWKPVSWKLAAIGLAFAACGCSRWSPPAVRAPAGDVVALRASFGAVAGSTGGPAAAAAEPNGFATITGSIKIKGTPPAATPLAITADMAVCMPGGKQVLSDSLLVDSATQGIKDVAVYLYTKYPDGDPNWEHESYAADATATKEYDQKVCVFLDHMFIFRSSQKLKILNSDPVGHNTNIAGGGKMSPFSQTIAGNSYTMYEPGGEAVEPVPVACNIHNWMSARMLARKNPYFAVTKADGTFEIAHVPAGVDLEFRVWHERTKFIPAATVNGKDMPGLKGRIKLKLTADQPQQLDLVVDAGQFNK